MGYEQLKLKDFKFWTLYLHENQFPYIGRCYAWINANKEGIMDMSSEEREELFTDLIPQRQNVIDQLYRPNKINLMIAGDRTSHLHAHLIPRFNKKINLYGIEFIDPNPHMAVTPPTQRKSYL